MPDNWVDKRRSFSFRGIGWRLLNLGVKLAIACVGLGIFGTLSQPGKPIRSIALIAGIGIVLVVLNNLNDWLKEKASGRKRNNEDIVFTLISGAIEQLRDDRSSGKVNVEKLLTNIESVTKLVMGPDSHGTQVSANLMLRKYNPSSLTLAHWGTRLEGRVNIDLPIDKDNLKPGAPTACHRDEVIYIPDTQSEKYDSIFAGKAYRSIVSIPVRIAIPQRHISGVINIDSDQPDYFRSEKFISSELIPKLMPFVHLMSLEVAYPKVSESATAPKK